MREAHIYEITVRGSVPPAWSERLGGMKVIPGNAEDGTPITTLIGEARDQAALAGVLDTLYQIHLVILSVTMQQDPVEWETLLNGEGSKQ